MLTTLSQVINMQHCLLWLGMVAGCGQPVVNLDILSLRAADCAHRSELSVCFAEEILSLAVRYEAMDVE